MTDIYESAGAQWGVDPLLLQAINQVESGGNPAATSPAGAEGNMQFMPGTARATGVADPREPAFAVPGTAKLLDSYLRGPAKGDLTTALRMYQGGENSAKWGAANAAYPAKVAAAYAALKAKAGSQPQVYAQANPATMSDDDLTKALGGGNAPAASAPEPTPATMSDEDLAKALKGEPEYPVVPVHPAPDGSGAMTNLSDADYAKFQKEIAEQNRASAPTGPASAQPSTSIDVNVPVRRIGGLAAGWPRGSEPPDPNQPAPGAGQALLDTTKNALAYTGGVLGAASHGLSFGLDKPLDELTASLPSWMVPFQQDYKKYVDQAYGAEDTFKAAHPLAAGVAEAAGSIPTYVAGERALATVAPEIAGSGLLTKAGNLVREGARNAVASGALSAGTADGDMADRAAAGAKGAAIGAVAPGVFSGLGAVLHSATAPIMARISGSAAENQAVNAVGKALTRDAMTPADLAANVQRLGPDATLADAGGTNMLRLGETVANVPGEAANKAASFLENRAAGQAGRINDAIAAATGSTGDFHAAMGDLAQNRATEAAPRYEAAFSRIKVTPEEADKVQRFIHDKIGQDALQKGLRVVELEKLAANEPFNPADYGVAKGDDGRFVLEPGVPNLRLMDAVKRGYDEIVEGFRDPTTGRLNLNQYGRAVNDVRASYVKDLREMFPRYAGALDAWAGPSRAMDALSMGRRALSNDPEVNAKAIANLSDTDKQFFLSGVARALKDKVESAQDGADATRRIFGNQLIRDKIKAALGSDKAFSEFAQTMEREAAFARTRNEVLKGSQTARRLAGQNDLSFDAATPARHLLSGNPLAAAMHAGGQAMNALSALPPATNPILGRMLFTPGVDQDLLAAVARNRNPLLYPLARQAAVNETNRLMTGTR